MNLLTVEKVSKNYTDRLLLNDITLGINEGDKIGIIGINGTGKSTLLKIAAEIEEPDTGTVIRGNKVKTVYLPQYPVLEDKLTILENVLKDEKGKSIHWEKEGEAKAMLNRLGIVEFSQRTGELSGGQKKRAALVRTLMHPADILILDEPTNHLDQEMADWLEEYLKKYSGAFLLVTHDRYFLDSAANKIVEIDRGNLYQYQGSYSEYLKLKSEREEMEAASERKKKSLYRIELEWIKRGARARSTKQKARAERFEQLKNRETAEMIPDLEISSVSTRLGKKIMELKHISKSFGEKILVKDFNYVSAKGDRIGIVGKNGSGKTTFLNMITGEIKPDSGEVILGPTVKIGYFAQNNEKLDEGQRVIDYVKNTAEYVKTEEGSISASKMLERFMFSGSMQYSPIGKLSGGEKRRLYLLKILMEAPNVLILDEPTNDLDIRTLTILEDYLDHFQGIILTVSHDRYFLDRVAKRIFSFEENGSIEKYEGGYTDYKIAFDRKKEKMSAQNEIGGKEEVEKKKVYNKTREKKLKFSYKEEREFEVIDDEIAQLEKRIQELEKQIEAHASDFIKLNELTIEKEKLDIKLEEKTDRWVYLNDLAERIQQENSGR